MGKLSMRKISEILRQKFDLHRSNRDIARSLNISLSTISDYLSRARAIGLSWPLPTGLTEQDLYNKLFLPTNSAARNRPLPNWETIHQELRKKGMTLQLLWREYREQYPEGVGYSMFCNYYVAYKKTISPIMRQKYKAGEKTFVDYAGMRLEWVDLDGEIFPAEIFVGCLGASQLIYVEATETQQLHDWISSHVNMFEFFGGVTEIIVPDNLKSAVTKTHRYDPDINANYQHFAEHYGVAIVPARSYAPTHKAKVENAVKIVEMQILAPLRRRVFANIAEINTEIKIRNLALNKQQFQKMKTSRVELFEQIDKPALKPLPACRYQYATWKNAKINIDYHFTFDDCYYSVPYKYLGKQVQLRATAKTIECFHDNIRIAAHPISNKKHSFSTIEEHMPKSHQEQSKISIDMIRRWAHRIGGNTTQFIEHLMATRHMPQQSYRACLGVLRLSNAYGEYRLEKACAKALSVGADRYKHIENILKNNLEEEPINNDCRKTPLKDHENIRGPNFYH